MRIGLNSPQDLLALLVRRKWWVVAPFLAMSSAVFVLTLVLPATYVSETLVLVRPRDVPVQFVMDLIAGSTQQRLSTIEQTLRSRTTLVQILREFEDKLTEFKPLNMDARVSRLNDQIKITFQLEESGNQPALTSFRIAYQNRDPGLAQQIANKLTTLFIEQDHRVRETQVFGTTEFLAAEVKKIEDDLGASDKQLMEFKRLNQFELPGQLETNLRTLDRLAIQRQSNVDALDRYAELRLNLERQISGTPEEISVTQVTTASAPPAAAPNPLVEEYRKAQLDYEKLLADRLTAKHPLVESAKARLDRLKELIPLEIALAEAPADSSESTANIAASRMVPNPLHASLMKQLQEVKSELAIREKERERIEAETQKYNIRVENTPETEQQIAEALRLNEDLQKQYNDLKGKLADAKLAESLEGRQRGGQFSIVDPANYPLVPSKPNKMMVLMGGIMASFVAALAIAVGVDVARQRIWTQSQIEAFWGVPILIDIPEILTDSDLARVRKKKYAYALSSVAAVAVYGVCLYVMYAKHSFILQQLDPVLQKLVYR
jgi:succinoglycan biosynthesis transport protein ExoP